MKKNFIDYTYFINSQIPFLLIFVGILLFFYEFNWVYGLFFILCGIFFVIPITHLLYMIKKTNKTPFFVFNKEQKKFSSKKYLWYVFLWIIPFIIQYFNEINKFIEQHIPIYFIPYIILIILTMFFIFYNNNYEYWIFENFLFVNILKYKMIEVKNKEGNVIQVFTRKNIKKFEKINLQHISGGIYYY